MLNNTIGSKGYPQIIAIQGAHGDALTQIISILITSVFWFALAMLLLILQALHVLPLDRLYKFYQAMCILGLSPILLTVLSRRGVEWLCYKYINHYIKTYVQKQT